MNESYPKTINVTSLRVNPNNVRYEEAAEDQTAAIKTIILDQGRKFVNLAKDISVNGLEPGRTIYVHPVANTNEFVVLDGNRRMSAVKVLLTKELQEEFKEILPKNFGSVSEHFHKNNKVEFVECTVFDHEESAQHWIAVNHGFGTEGITTQNWDSDTRDKVMASYGRKKRERDGQVLDYLRESPLVPESLKARLRKGKTNNTTLRRILSDDALPEIGIHFKDGLLSFTAAERESIKALSRIVMDLIDKKVKVERVWDAEKRKVYLNDLRLDGDMPDFTVSANSVETPKSATKSEPSNQRDKQDNEETDKQNGADGTPPAKRPRAVKKSREYIFSKSLTIKDKNSRIADIYNELTRIKVTENVNAVSLLLRAFVEMLVKEYGKKYSIPGVGKEATLRDSVSKVVDHYINTIKSSGGLVNEGDFRGIREACDVKNLNSMFAIESFQQLVHREKLKPIPSELVDRWDNIESAIVHLLDNM